MVAVRQGRRVGTQVKEGAHPRVFRDLGFGRILVGVAHGRQARRLRGRGFLLALVRRLARGRTTRAGRRESGGGLGLVDGGCKAEGLKPSAPKVGSASLRAEARSGWPRIKKRVRTAAGSEDPTSSTSAGRRESRISADIAPWLSRF